jgi:hypothetical protein
MAGKAMADGANTGRIVPPARQQCLTAKAAPSRPWRPRADQEYVTLPSGRKIATIRCVPTPKGIEALRVHVRMATQLTMGATGRARADAEALGIQREKNLAEAEDYRRQMTGRITAFAASVVLEGHVAAFASPGGCPLSVCVCRPATGPTSVPDAE